MSYADSTRVTFSRTLGEFRVYYTTDEHHATIPNAMETFDDIQACIERVNELGRPQTLYEQRPVDAFELLRRMTNDMVRWAELAYQGDT